ncbi:TPA: DNA-protecting protein DprA [Candidatus Uhrbacteria bacterium]|nr:DNA-protecting protein DprA [Candidatus Uhrbacteria bacterium]
MNQNVLSAWLMLARAHVLHSTQVRRVLLRLRDPIRLVETFNQHAFPPSIVKRFSATRHTFDFDKEQALLQKQNVHVLSWTCDAYPVLLKEIHDPPPLLFYKGSLPTPSQVLISMVGSRRATAYGHTVTSRLAGDLTRMGFGIVSGLALGIDGDAHKAALSQGGYTLAVLAGGLDEACLSPSFHIPLARDILAADGCLVSEHPIGTAAEAHNFPQRNRIVAGLSRATIVVEAALKSGSLISADCALAENREVCAVPGMVTSDRSAGTHALIRQGATLVTCANDVLEVIDLEASQTAQVISNHTLHDPTEQRILNELDHEPTLMDDLSRTLTMPVTDLAGHLTLMELKRLVLILPGGYITRVV